MSHLGSSRFTLPVTAVQFARRSISRARRPSRTLKVMDPYLPLPEVRKLADPKKPEASAQKRPPGYRGHTYGKRPLGPSAQKLIDNYLTTPEYSMQQLFEQRYLPSPSKLPNAPDSLLQEPKGAVLNSELREFVQGTTVAATVTPRRDVPERFRCTLQCLLPPDLKGYRVMGTGTTKMLAEKAAYLHLLVLFNELGILQELWGSFFVARDQDVAADTKVDVYNYAAQYGLIPRIQYKQRMLLGRLTHNVTIDLPEHKISASGRAQSRTTAEYAAVLEFKELTAEYQKKYWTARPPSPKYCFSTKNAYKFFEFLEGLGRVKARVEVVEDEQDGKTVHVARLFLHTVPQGTLVQSPAVDVPTAESSQTAVDLANLTSAVMITRHSPRLRREFFGMEEGTSPPLFLNTPPVQLQLNVGELVTMRTVLELLKVDDVPRLRLSRSKAPLRNPDISALPTVDSPQEKERLNDLLLNRNARYNQDPRVRYLREARAKLPISSQRDQLMQGMRDSGGCIVVGQTGCGKTTQVPQMILEEAERRGQGVDCNVICTQPRRIAAISAARRVAYERGEKVGSHVGYLVRFEQEKPQSPGSITYCTNGVLLQQMRQDPASIFSGASHIIIDEVHERSLEMDFLLLLIKRTLRDRIRLGFRVPKIILMSATVDPAPFVEYFKDVFAESSSNPLLPTIKPELPVIYSKGRSHPIRSRYLAEILDEMLDAHGEAVPRRLEDDVSRGYIAVEKAFSRIATRNTNTYMRKLGENSGEEISAQDEESSDSTGPIISDNRDADMVPISLVAATIAHIMLTQPEGAILVFLPGLEEIEKVAYAFEARRPFMVGDFGHAPYEIHKLHGSMSVQQQERAFSEPTKGYRKIILATNVAETSITVPDVCYVVDTGKAREQRFNPIHQLTSLETVWISKSNKEQRAGRSGRVQPGNYYGLFSKERFESLPEIGTPEMQRADLHSTCLQARDFESTDSIQTILSEAIAPPPGEAVHSALASLKAMEALDPVSDLTPLGRVLAHLPVHPAFGKMIVLGLIFRCLQPMLVIGAALHEKDMMFNRAFGRSEQLDVKRALLGNHRSDHLAKWKIFKHIRKHFNVPFADIQFITSTPSVHQRDLFNMAAFHTVEKAADVIRLRLEGIGLVGMRDSDEDYLNQNSGNDSLIIALLVAGLPRKLAVHQERSYFRSMAFDNLTVHPSSINKGFSDVVDRHHTDVHAHNALLAYSRMLDVGGHHKVPNNDRKTKMLRDTTVITPLMAALFGGPLHMGQIDEWLPLQVSSHGGGEEVLLKFRESLDDMLRQSFDELADGKPLKSHPIRELFVQSIVQLFRKEGMEMAAHKQAEFARRMKGMLLENMKRSRVARARRMIVDREEPIPGTAVPALEQFAMRALMMEKVTKNADKVARRNYMERAVPTLADAYKLHGGKRSPRERMGQAAQEGLMSLRNTLI